MNETNDSDNRGRIDEENAPEREPAAGGDESLEDLLKPWSPGDLQLDLPTDTLELDGENWFD